MSTRKCGWVIPAVTGMLALAASAGAATTTIVYDTFTWNEAGWQSGWATNMIQNAAHSPDIDLPGGTWQLDNSANDTNGIGIHANDYLNIVHEGGSTGISLASSGSYTKPANLGISVGSLKWNATPAGGYYALVGFYSALDGTTGYNEANTRSGFTGLRVNDDGSLQLVENGVNAGSAIAYTGSWSPTTAMSLSYDVNTLTGAISNVSLSGSTSTYSFNTTAFTDANTLYAGLGGYSANTTEIVMDNFTVTGSTVPEPAALSLLALGGTAMLRRNRKR